MSSVDACVLDAAVGRVRRKSGLGRLARHTFRGADRRGFSGRALQTARWGVVLEAIAAASQISLIVLSYLLCLLAGFKGGRAWQMLADWREEKKKSGLYIPGADT